MVYRYNCSYTLTLRSRKNGQIQVKQAENLPWSKAKVDPRSGVENKIEQHGMSSAVQSGRIVQICRWPELESELYQRFFLER